LLRPWDLVDPATGQDTAAQQGPQRPIVGGWPQRCTTPSTTQI
jgi:hypothetical protein